jgi:hypothetical protein
VTQSLSIDVDELLALTPELDEIANYAAAALERLRLTLSNAGAYWGTGQTGTQFAATFQPDSEQALRYMEELVSSLQSQAEYVRSTVSQIQAQDLLNARQVAAPVQDTAGSAPAAAANSPQSSSAPVDLMSTTAPASAAVSPSTANSGAPSSADAGTTAPSNQSQPPSNADGSAGPQPANGSPAQAVPAYPQAAAAAEAQPRPRAASRGSSAANATPEPEADDSPWAGSAAEDSPWSTHSARPPSGAAASEMPGRPAARRASGEGDEEAAGKPGGRAQADAAREAEAEQANPNTALAAALAARHGIEVLGFDSPGVDEHTAREFAAAVDDMLAAYPVIDLRTVAIDALDDGEVTRTTWGIESGTVRPAPHTARITFALAAAVGPGTFAAAVAEAVDAGYLSRGVQTRPVYYAVVREFGHALDIAGSFRARAAAQRSLIAEYFSTAAPDPGAVRLATMVDGYRLWRAQVSGACFDGPRLDPAMALADAFTEIQLRGGDAGQPAKALHRLLVEAARVTAIG